MGEFPDTVQVPDLERHASLSGRRGPAGSLVNVPAAPGRATPLRYARRVTLRSLSEVAGCVTVTLSLLNLGLLGQLLDQLLDLIYY